MKATARDFQDHLAPALALVAPTGFSREDRVEWLRAAALTLEEVPGDLLARGCAAARKVADHPSKIVPAIFAEIEIAMRLYRADQRQEGLRRVASETKTPALSKPTEDFVTPCQASEILKEFNLR